MNHPDSTDLSRSESKLVRLAQQGNESAFANLFEAHKKQIYSLCLTITSSPSHAESCTEQAFLQVFRRLATHRGDVAFSAWLSRAAAATALLHLRNAEKSAPAREPSVLPEAIAGTGTAGVLCL